MTPINMIKYDFIREKSFLIILIGVICVPIIIIPIYLFKPVDMWIKLVDTFFKLVSPCSAATFMKALFYSALR